MKEKKLSRFWGVSLRRQDQDIRANSLSSTSISYDDDDDDDILDMIDDYGASASASIPLVPSNLLLDTSAELSANSTRIRVNPQSETVAADINANVSACRPLQGEQEPGSRDPPELPPPLLRQQPQLSPLGSSKVIHGCSFRLLYHGLSEIDELQPDSSVAPGCWKYRTKKSMVEEAVLKLKVGHRLKTRTEKKRKNFQFHPPNLPP